MAPELLNSQDAEELVQLAHQIQQYQDRKKWSDSEMIRKFPGLGSTKTYKRLLKRDLDEVDLENQLSKYRAVHTLIENLGDAEELREMLYDDLTPVLRLRNAFVDVMTQTGDARFLLVLGDSGAGKTSSRRLLIEKYGQRILWTEATAAVGDSPMAFLGEILRACGEKNPPHSTVVRLRKVIEHLQASRVCLIVDEGHHLGPTCLDTIKTLVNNTPGEFVVMAMYKLWKDLEREAYETVKQLTGNRLAERIQLHLVPSDVHKMITRRLTWSEEESAAGIEKAAHMLCEQAPRFGNLAFVREVCKQANQMADGEPVDLKLFSAALAAKGATR